MSEIQITLLPLEKKIVVPVGIKLQEVLEQAGISFDFPCGGRGKCLKCRVQVIKGAASPTPAEKEAFTEEELQTGSRLACQTVVNEEMIVFLPEQHEHKILHEAGFGPRELDPPIKKIYVDIPLPSLKDQRSDCERIRKELIDKALVAPVFKNLSLFREFPEVIRAAKFKITAVTDGKEVLGIEEGETTETLLGMAFDIGTTTIVGYLLDLVSGKELAVVSDLNPQTRHGADVISRITYAAEDQEGLQRLQDLVIDVINNLIGKATAQAGVNRKDIYALSFVGNTCMHHLFLAIPPRQLAVSPYVPVFNDSLICPAKDLGLEINKSGQIFLPPVIAGFVGSDTIGVILATELHKKEGISLAVDIGTNGEMVLGGVERLVSCSTAAGPAFEGAQITCGMRGAQGAMDHIQIEEDIAYTVIGDCKPQGICGSALIDIVAGLLQKGIINSRGKLLSAEELKDQPVSAKLKKRIIEYEGMRAFLLADSAETVNGKPVVVTQKDIRELQLAKGAIATGISVLLDVTGTKLDDVQELVLAGAFGNYLDPHSACSIGLVPAELEDRVRPVGNAAGAGAKACLISQQAFAETASIVQNVEYVELGSHPNFNNLFAKALSFSEQQKIKTY